MTLKYPRQLALGALLCVFLLGFAVRIWRVESAPSGALIDELHFGYIAHSLIETGTDEHGEAWPLTFRGFGDEKLPAMAYLDIPSVYFFGLRVLAIRLPSVIAGSLLILAVYWLAREFEFRRSIALLAATITALTPWTFFLSRFGFESNVALCFFVVGLAFLARGLRQQKMLSPFIWSGVFLGLSWYSYIAYRPVTVGLLVGLILLVLLQQKNTPIKKRLAATKPLLLSLATLVLVVLPLFQPKLVGTNSTRFDQVGILSDPSLAAVVIEKRNFCVENLPQLLCYASFNKPFYLLRETTRRYLESFSPDFLVGRGELTTDFLTVDGFGQFYPILYPFFILGVGGLVLRVRHTAITPKEFLVLAGLLLAPVPSALVGDPQKVRISALFPFVLLAMMYGLFYSVALIRKKQIRNASLVVVGGLFIAMSVVYLVEFFGVHSTQHEYKYQSFAPAISHYIDSLPAETLVNIEPFYSDPLMFYAFYSKLPPQRYQELAVLGELEPGGFQHTTGLGRISAEKTNIIAFGCMAKEQGRASVYITKQDIHTTDKLYEIKASNGVHSYAYAYDASLFVKDLYCDQL